jgi:hypothetical protein
MARSPESELASRFSLTTLFLATTQTTTGRSPKDDFSVLKDPTVMLKTTRTVNQIVPSSPSTQSPNPKRGRTNQESTLINEKSNANVYGKENVSRLFKMTTSSF